VDSMERVGDCLRKFNLRRLLFSAKIAKKGRNSNHPPVSCTASTATAQCLTGQDLEKLGL
jgi:hypothetical protein